MRWFRVSLLALILLGLAPVQAQDINDPLYRGGARNLAAPVREDLLGLDALARAKVLGKLIACADPYNYPYSNQSSEPPGFDVEIFRAITKRAGLRAEMFWSDTGTRGGLGRALRGSIDKGKCDLFLGLSMAGDDDELKDHKLTFTKPYLGLGYVLVVQRKAAHVKTLEELKGAGVKIGVSMSTPMDDYLFTHGYDRELYFQNRRVVEGIAKGEVDAIMVWATALGEARVDQTPAVKEFDPARNLQMVPGYVPEPGLRWNIAMAVAAKDTPLKQFLDESIEELLKDGQIKQIVEDYGVPFFAPFQ